MLQEPGRRFLRSEIERIPSQRMDGSVQFCPTGLFSSMDSHVIFYACISRALYMYSSAPPHLLQHLHNHSINQLMEAPTPFVRPRVGNFPWSSLVPCGNNNNYYNITRGRGADFSVTVDVMIDQSYWQSGVLDLLLHGVLKIQKTWNSVPDRHSVSTGGLTENQMKFP